MSGRVILHDEEIYSDSHEFLPERWLKGGELDVSVQDPYVASFGFGRRISPGRHFTMEDAFILIASILAVYKIERKAKTLEQKWPPQLETTSTLMTCVIFMIPVFFSSARNDSYVPPQVLLHYLVLRRLKH